MVLVAIATALVMYLLVRRLMRGMNQQDWILLRQARMRGVDVTSPQPVGFVLFTNDIGVANELAARLRQDAFETSIKEAQIQYARNRKKPNNAQAGWLVMATQVVRLVPEELIAKRKALDEIAAAPRAVYLGWQVGGIQQPPPPAA